VIDADEDAHGGAGVGVEERDEFGGAAIEGLGVEFERARGGRVRGCWLGCRRRARGCVRG
jgi:hypothetical protein